MNSCKLPSFSLRNFVWISRQSILLVIWKTEPLISVEDGTHYLEGSVQQWVRLSLEGFRFKKLVRCRSSHDFVREPENWWIYIPADPNTVTKYKILHLLHNSWLQSTVALDGIQACELLRIEVVQVSGVAALGSEVLMSEVELGPRLVALDW